MIREGIAESLLPCVILGLEKACFSRLQIDPRFRGDDTEWVQLNGRCTRLRKGRVFLSLPNNTLPPSLYLATEERVAPPLPQGCHEHSLKEH